jgi:hypothetical protein
MGDKDRNQINRDFEQGGRKAAGKERVGWRGGEKAAERANGLALLRAIKSKKKRA